VSESAMLAALEARVDELFALPHGSETPRDAASVVNQLLEALESGAVRSAVRGDDGSWRAVPWVKRGILVGFRFGKLADLSPSGVAFSFVFDLPTGATIVATFGAVLLLVAGYRLAARRPTLA